MQPQSTFDKHQWGAMKEAPIFMVQQPGTTQQEPFVSARSLVKCLQVMEKKYKGFHRVMSKATDDDEDRPSDPKYRPELVDIYYKHRTVGADDDSHVSFERTEAIDTGLDPDWAATPTLAPIASRLPDSAVQWTPNMFAKPPAGDDEKTAARHEAIIESLTRSNSRRGSDSDGSDIDEDDEESGIPPAAAQSNPEPEASGGDDGDSNADSQPAGEPQAVTEDGDGYDDWDVNAVVAHPQPSNPGAGGSDTSSQPGAEPQTLADDGDGYDDWDVDLAAAPSNPEPQLSEGGDGDFEASQLSAEPRTFADDSTGGSDPTLQHGADPRSFSEDDDGASEPPSHPAADPSTAVVLRKPAAAAVASKASAAVSAPAGPTGTGTELDPLNFPRSQWWVKHLILNGERREISGFDAEDPLVNAHATMLALGALKTNVKKHLRGWDILDNPDFNIVYALPYRTNGGRHNNPVPFVPLSRFLSFVGSLKNDGAVTLRELLARYGNRVLGADEYLITDLSKLQVAYEKMATEDPDNFMLLFRSVVKKNTPAVQADRDATSVAGIVGSSAAADAEMEIAAHQSHSKSVLDRLVGLSKEDGEMGLAYLNAMIKVEQAAHPNQVEMTKRIQAECEIVKTKADHDVKIAKIEADRDIEIAKENRKAQEAKAREAEAKAREAEALRPNKRESPATTTSHKRPKMTLVGTVQP